METFDFIMQIHRFYWRMIRGVMKAVMKLSVSAGRGGATLWKSANLRSAQRGGRGSRQGVLCPGDESPPPGVDVLDYRGVASANELAALRDGEPPLGRLYDPRGRRQFPVGLPPQLVLRHAAVMGPTGAGKTRSIIVPWIVSLLRQGWSVAAIDVKGDLLDEIAAETTRTGGSTGSRLWVWDYAAGRSHRWNWLNEISDPRSVEMAVTSILGRPQPNDPQPHFYHRDYRWLRALIQLVTTSPRRGNAVPRDILDLIADQKALVRALAGSGVSVQTRTDLGDLAQMEVDEYSRAAAGLTNVLGIFGAANVESVTSASDFDLGRIGDGPTLLVGVAPLADGRMGEILSGLLITQVILRVFANFRRSGSARPLLLVVDEAPRLKDRIDLEQLLSIARGANTGVCLAAQDVSQFGDTAQRTAILANCHTFVTMPGVAAETALFLGSRLGQRQTELRSTNRSTGGSLFGTIGVGSQTVTVPVLGAREIMHPPFGPYVAIAHVPSVSRRPFLIDLEK